MGEPGRAAISISTTAGASAASSASEGIASPYTPTPPTTPSRTRNVLSYARRLEDYELEDSPRHSRESTRSLLGRHERNSSLNSPIGIDNAGINGSFRDSYSKRDGTNEEDDGLVHTGKALRSIMEDAEETGHRPSMGNAHQAIDEDEFPLLNGAATDNHDQHPARRRSASISCFSTKARSFIHDNRGLLMIALAQGAFAIMNVMVRSIFFGDC